MHRVHLAMLALVVVWGFNFALVKATFDELPPLVFNGLRFALASTLLFLATRSREPAASGRVEWRKLFVLGLIGNSAYQLFFILGLARTTAGNSSIILAATPIFIALLGAVLRIEQPTRRTWAGILLAFVGILLLVGGKDGISLSSRIVAGDILIILCTLCWSVYTVFSRPLLNELSPLRLTAITMALGTPALILAALPQMIRLDWMEVTWRSWVALAFSATFAVALGYVVWYTSVQIVGNTRTAVYSNLIPVVALVSAWLLLGETISAIQGTGAAIVLAGVSLARSNSLPPSE
jgi:drug/metabolite transporter (DMT)-like permease